jgi:hypothetical protein
MAKKLTDNLSSLYVQAANSLRPKTARKKIVAYVESYDDVPFWSHILSQFANDKYYFQVMLPSSSTLAKGKKVAMMNRLGNSLGENMISCVDADYDYLLQGATSTSRKLIRSPFVIHTYAYAIENYQCYPTTLHDVCVQATLNDHEYINFPAFFRLYSNIIYPLFIWNIWCYRTGRHSVFSIQDFSEATRLSPVSFNVPVTSLEQVAGKVRRKLEWLKKRFAKNDEQIEALKAELLGLGVTPDNTFLFVQGHHLKDNVTMKILIPLCARLRREREEEIKNLALHNQQFQNELSSYRHSGETVETILRKNIHPEAVPTFELVKRDIERLLEACRKHDERKAQKSLEEQEPANLPDNRDATNEENSQLKNENHNNIHL